MFLLYFATVPIWGGLGIIFSGFASIVLFKMLIILIKNKKNL